MKFTVQLQYRPLNTEIFNYSHPRVEEKPDSNQKIEWEWVVLGLDDAMVKNLPADEETRDADLIPGSGRSPGEGSGN